jgi:acyl-lipid (7-3)-desaturase (Delta-4 desaturase)
MPVTKRNSNTTLKKTRSATPSSPKRKAKKSTSSKTSKKNFHGLVLTSAQLLQYPDLVAVDGFLYDLKGFAKVHPGGGQIRAAGAYDATALYHSMHPFSDPSKSKLFQKYKVGIHIPSSNDPKYIFNSAFAQDLKRSVRNAMGKDSWYAPLGFMLRTLYIMAAVIFFEYMWITTGNLWCGIALGYYHAQIGLCIQHDGSHGAISNNSIVNSFFAWFIELIGSSRWIWMEQHILWHHPHTNHQLLDPDASSAEPLVVFKDYSKEINFKSNENGTAAAKKTPTPLVAAQEWITHFVLALYGPSVVYNPVLIYTLRHNDYVPEALANGDFMSVQRPITIAWRLFYYFRVVFLPIYIAGANVFVALFLVSFVVGICLTWVFVLSHNFEGADRDPLKLTGDNSGYHGAGSKTTDNNNDANDICWYKMQCETSSSYGGNFAMFTTGGLNFQIEHHIFPRMSSWHYPRISHVVKECCQRHGVTYNYFPYIWDNTVSTLRYMRKVGLLAVIQHAREEF